MYYEGNPAEGVAGAEVPAGAQGVVHVDVELLGVGA